MSPRNLTLSLALCLTAGLVACSEPAASADQPATEPLPAGLGLAAPPADAVRVPQAKASAREGDTVVVRGRVGGERDPIVPGRASLRLADTEAIAACDTRPDDGCKIPWDYCCEPSEKILANSMTVQVVGDSGKVLAADFTTLDGLEPGSMLVVTGVVAARPNEQVLTVNATGIYVEP